ncbi:MAG: hypothetical protein GEU83_19040 [Pseudonocardiaceae bacterium]|nr:hypothetical protein [Pseudonocardiaceae bacterium]
MVAAQATRLRAGHIETVLIWGEHDALAARCRDDEHATVTRLREAGTVARWRNPDLWDAMATSIVRQVIRAGQARKLYRAFCQAHDEPLHRQALRPLPPGPHPPIGHRRAVIGSSAVPGHVTRDHRRISPDPHRDFLYCRPSASPRQISSRSGNVNIFRTVSILSHRTAKINCYDRLTPSHS